jgi:hypothetical protein
MNVPSVEKGDVRDNYAEPTRLALWRTDWESMARCKSHISEFIEEEKSLEHRYAQDRSLKQAVHVWSTRWGVSPYKN